MPPKKSKDSLNNPLPNVYEYSKKKITKDMETNNKKIAKFEKLIYNNQSIVEGYKQTLIELMDEKAELELLLKVC